MLGQTTRGAGSISSSASRVFRYEVVGLRQTSQTSKQEPDIRRSGSVFMTVPYNRMSEQMQRINRLGGTIVSIEELTLVLDLAKVYPSAVPHRGGGRR
ncbi:phycobilisome linker polypeptide [Fortiea contorta]|uniref:phycobilisome linker polypeptide n=1 Tax=Fortiea contorta TaxID=1892405 RepID=UPI00034C0903|nr:phycobilisome linker polypeptide [Fortiea contorta]